MDSPPYLTEAIVHRLSAVDNIKATLLFTANPRRRSVVLPAGNDNFFFAQKSTDYASYFFWATWNPGTSGTLTIKDIGDLMFGEWYVWSTGGSAGAFVEIVELPPAE